MEDTNGKTANSIGEARTSIKPPLTDTNRAKAVGAEAMVEEASKEEEVEDIKEEVINLEINTTNKIIITIILLNSRSSTRMVLQHTFTPTTAIHLVMPLEQPHTMGTDGQGLLTQLRT